MPRGIPGVIDLRRSGLHKPVIYGVVSLEEEASVRFPLAVPVAGIAARERRIASLPTGIYIWSGLRSCGYFAVIWLSAWKRRTLRAVAT